jgi:hypothetical protein
MRAVTIVLLATAVAVGAGSAVAAKVKVNVQKEKTFDFGTVRTYAWHPDGAGDVKMLQANQEEGPRIKAQLDPVIRQAVEQGLAARGLRPAPSAADADVYVNYYLLIGAGMSSQYLGQFIGNAPEWGLPPIAGGTTSLEIYEQGSLVLDLASRVQKSVIWRGTAQAEIDRQRDEAARRERVRDAVRRMIEKYPKVKGA